MLINFYYKIIIFDREFIAFQRFRRTGRNVVHDGGHHQAQAD
jgi:hypothetical protein